MIGGYEPKSSDAFFKRTEREYARFAKTWQLKTENKPRILSQNGHIATINLATSGTDWNVNTEFNLLVWNKLVLADFARPLPVRLMHYIITFLDYVFSGTLISFFRTNWRFALYFLYPATALLTIALISIYIAKSLLLMEFPGNLIASTIVGIALFTTLLIWVGGRWHVVHLMDLWSFSRYFLRDKRPDAQALIEIYAKAIVDCARSEKFDEIILIGHSTGGAMILAIAAAALAQDSHLASGKSKITILTIGSTALKVGLHPAAKTFRRKVQTLVNGPDLNWVEYQSLTDIINFYKTDPVREMGLENNRTDEFPIVRRVRIREMLEPEIYARVKRNFFRVHYQFILANTRPYHYDFFAICCAPLYLKQRAQTKQSALNNPDAIEKVMIGDQT